MERGLSVKRDYTAAWVRAVCNCRAPYGPPGDAVSVCPCAVPCHRRPGALLTAIRFWKEEEGVMGILPPTLPNRRSSDSWTDSAARTQHRSQRTAHGS